MNKSRKALRQKQKEEKELLEICANCKRKNGEHRVDNLCPPDKSYDIDYYLHWDKGPGTYFKPSNIYSDI